MSPFEQQQLHKQTNDLPILAILDICYNFDKTLSPDDLQAQVFIQEVVYDVKKFWAESNELAKNNDMDTNLAYMYKMLEASYNNFYLNKKALMEYGSKVELFNGVETWFKRICDYGKAHGVLVEHYIISSGLKEMIEGMVMAKDNAFKKIYASSFLR